MEEQSIKRTIVIQRERNEIENSQFKGGIVSTIDETILALLKLAELRRNIQNMPIQNSLSNFAHQFNIVLSKLEDIGIDVSHFRIPDSEAFLNGGHPGYDSYIFKMAFAPIPGQSELQAQ